MPARNAFLHGDAALFGKLSSAEPRSSSSSTRTGRARQAASPPAIIVDEIHAALEMRGIGKNSCRHAVGGAGAAGIDGVDVHVEIVGDVAANHGALEEMHIVERVGDPRRVIEVLRGGFADLGPILDVRPHVPQAPRPCRSATRVPVRSRSNFGSRAQSVGCPWRRLPACPSTSARGKRIRPSSPRIAPGAGQDLDARWRGLRTGRWFPAHRALPRGCAAHWPQSAAEYCPPLMPGRIGLRFSASGAVANRDPVGAAA